jgi:hypothetical protein
MVPLGALWLPILLSAILVFFASALAWMVLPHHRNDWSSAPAGDRVQELMRGVAPGQYVYPRVLDPAERKDADAQRRYSESSGFIIVREPDTKMGKMMVLSMAHYVFISILVAYITTLAVPAGAPYMTVFRVASATAILGYVGALFAKSIWWGSNWGATLKEVLDGIVYGLLTAGVFAWLWP